MFSFKYVELMNWAYWPTIKLPLDARTIMITGPNGSGKTTFLDALRTLLRVPRLSANRRVGDYLVGNVDTAVVKAIATNEPDDQGRRPFGSKGLLDDEVTMAVILKRKSGRWERRFTIQGGDRSLQQLRELSKQELMTPASYSHVVKEAGFSNALLKVLALEQGQTDKLCEKSPRELMDLLLDVHGDKLIIDRYKEARQNYHIANMEITQLGARLSEEQAKVVIAQRRAEGYQRFHKLTAELHKFENELLPKAEYVSAQGLIQDAQLTLNDFKLHLGPLDREILDIQAALDNADIELDSRKRAVLTSREEKESLAKEERDLDIALNALVLERKRIEEILTAADEIGIERIEPLRNRQDEQRRSLAKLEIEREQSQARMVNLDRDLKALSGRSKQKIYPFYVAEFAAVLKAKGIEHDLLCDIVEITDSGWQLAVESIIGRDRFSVIVNRADQAAARKLAEKNRYRAYIVNREDQKPIPMGAAPANSALSVVSLQAEGVPTWVVDNLRNTTLVESVDEGLRLGRGSNTVTRAAYRQDRRGGISIATDQFYCGSMGRSAQAESTQKDAQTLRSQLQSVDSKIARLKEKEQALTKRIRVQEGLRDAKSAKKRRKGLDGEIPEANKAHKAALAVARAAERKLISKLEDLNNFERDSDEKRRWLREKRGSQSDFLTEMEDCQASIAKARRQIVNIEEKLDEEQLSKKALADVLSLDEITPRYYAVQTLLEEYEEPPAESSVHIYEHHKSQFDRQKELYQEHEVGLRNWENEYRLAREKYIVVVEHTIREYRKNVMALADRAGVSAEVVVPNLREEADQLEDAELSVRFGFDGKRAVDAAGATHSGGQRVVASLVLLMSLATSGGRGRGGFFIIDEPFAHLSIERIDDVSHFLEKTECQFILTSPTTHNVNVFTAAQLQLNFRIKHRDATYAEIPTIISR
jgi:chromosome segregation ATPase